MVLSRCSKLEDAMPQMVPSAGFTPPCDYSNFADSFDLSLLPGGESLTPVSPSTTLYAHSPPPLPCGIKVKGSPNSPRRSEDNDIDFGPDFQKLLGPEPNSKPRLCQVPSVANNIYLEVPQNCHPGPRSGSVSPYSSHSLLSPGEHFATYPSPNSDHQSFYPSSPETSLYPHSPNSLYSHSPADNYQQLIKREFYTGNYQPYVKEENFYSPCSTLKASNSPAYSVSASPDQEVLDLLGTAIIKQETPIDFENILKDFQSDTLRGLLQTSYKNPETQIVPEKPKTQDHQLLREVLRDTSFQKKYNIKPFEFALMETQIKMEQPDDTIINPCSDQLPREKIDPVLNMAIEQLKKDVNSTCAALGITPDPAQWSSANVLSWLQWTSNQFGLPAPLPDQWDISGADLVTLAEEDFARRAPQGGSILYAQLEIWKAAFSEEELGSPWMPESTSSNASSGDISEEEEDEPMPEAETSKPTTSRATGSSHIHLWQFLKELLASPQTHGSCIRWIDRTKGVFKIEDSVKVARLWGKRKNRPAMNYDKLSRSIRQYYKKGIMKKTERSQRLVYQFCHPYNL